MLIMFQLFCSATFPASRIKRIAYNQISSTLWRGYCSSWSSFIFAWIAELLTISTICRLVMLTIWLLHSFYAIIYLMGSICGNPQSCNICITLLRLAPLDSGKHAVEIMDYACDSQRNIVLLGRNLLPFSIVVLLHILIYIPVARGKKLLSAI